MRLTYDWWIRRGLTGRTGRIFWGGRPDNASPVGGSRAQAQCRKARSDFQKLSLDENIDRAVERSAELIALDDALKALSVLDEQKARMVELRYFGGLSIEETAGRVRGCTDDCETAMALRQGLAPW